MARLRHNLSIAAPLGILVATYVSPRPVLAASLNPVQVLEDSQSYGSLAVSPDGAHVYGTGNSFLFIFDRDPAAGTLALQQPISFFAELGGGVGSVGIEVSSDGEHVYVLSPGDDLFVFDRNPTTGAVSFVAAYDDLANTPGVPRQPTAMAMSTDGSSVYVAANDPLGEQSCGAIGVFARDAGDGTLTKVETEVLSAGACPGGGAIAVSPDDTNVYVNGENAVQVFTRSPGDGSLTAQQISSPTLLTDAGSDIAVAPDGANVYVATNERSRVVCDPVCITESYDAFGRDLSGDLAPLGTTEEEELREVAVGASGEHVLFASGRGGSVLLYDRAMPSGALTLSDEFKSPTEGTSRTPRALVVSPDSRHAYANIGQSVFVLQLTCGDGVVDPGESCDDGDTAAADGCSQQCQTEPCWSCSGEPSACSVVSNGTVCDDGSACTLADVCTGGVCAGSAEPDPTCSVPASGGITMKQGRSEKVVWKWNRGTALLEDFGDPVTTTDYTLCVYDDSARPQPIVELQPPRFCANSATSCWRADGNEGFEYTDYSRYPFRSISLRAGVGGRARVIVNASTFGAPLDLLPTLPLVTPVTVQLKTSDGECWQSTHSAAKVSNDTKFSAR